MAHLFYALGFFALLMFADIIQLNNWGWIVALILSPFILALFIREVVIMVRR